MTPTQVWADYNPTKEPLETAIVASKEFGNYIDNSLFFSVEKTRTGTLRAFCHIIYDKRWSDDRAAVLIIPSLVDKIDYSVLSKRLLSEGYVVCLVDYAGTFENTENKTVYPKELNYADIEHCRDHMYTIGDGAQSTPWFIWTKIIRRAISVMEEHRLINNDRIGIIGFGIGAQISWQVAGIDGRVQALLAINGGGFLWLKGCSKFTDSNVPASDETIAFSTGVGAETYAKFVSCPTCLIASTNSDTMDVDRAGDILEMAATKRKLLLIDKSAGNQITERTFDNALKWLRNNFAIDGDPSPSPYISFECSENTMYLKLYTDKTPTEQSVYICEGESINLYRYWTKLEEGQLISDNCYGYVIPIEDEHDLLVAFATVSYEDGSCASTPVVAAFPDKLGAEATINPGQATPHVIYPSMAGLETFSTSTRNALLDDTILHEAIGPYDITGVTTDDGNLSVLRTSKEMQTLTPNSTFKFDVYSKEPKELRIRVISKKDAIKYNTTIHLTGGDFWQRILLQCTDFKSEQGKSLQNFSNTSKCTFVDAKGLIFTNMLWI